MATAHIYLLLLQLLSLAADTVLAEFWNIDCGAATGHTNATTNLTWVTDTGYVRGGESHKLPADKTVGFATESSTLRAFPGKARKNCYTIPVEANTKIQVQLLFYYGNYDGVGKPPSFQLMFDSTDWDTVKTSTKGPNTYYIIYMTSRNHTNICLWRIKDEEVPFVSYIKVRTLEPQMYEIVTPNVSLYFPWRYSFGLNQTLPIGSPDDPYDREWNPLNTTWTKISDYEIVANSLATSVVNTSTSVHRPPAKLFGSAISAKRPSQNLTIRTDFVSKASISGTSSYPMYLNLYFSEMKSSLNLTEKRAFRFYIDNVEVYDSTAITPPIGQVLEIPAFIPQANATTTITLAPTADSTLPPVVSGLEALFIFAAFSDSWTNESDVVVLSWLQGNFSALQNWTGDPCLPIKYNWDWVQCSLDSTPRITKLYLGGFGLSGEIPDFSRLDALLSIDLQHNNLNGNIPEFLARFPKLESLNLAYNDFSSIPSLFNNTTILLNITGNPRLCEEGKVCIYNPNSPNAAPPPPPNNPQNATPPNANPFFPLLLIMLGISLIMLM